MSFFAGPQHSTTIIKIVDGQIAEYQVETWCETFQCHSMFENRDGSLRPVIAGETKPSEQWEGGALRACDHCGEELPCRWDENPMSEIYESLVGDCSWWCLACYCSRADEI